MENNKRNDTLKRPVLESGAGRMHTQLGELQRDVARIALQNHKKYQKIILAKPFFEHELYRVPDLQPWQKPFLQELLVRQLDRLIEEESLLERELTRIQLRGQELEVHKDELVASTINPYQVMKSVWNNNGRKGDAFEHIESLNQIVGHVRHSVRRLTEHERHASREEEERYLEMYKEMRLDNAVCKECPLKEGSKKQLRDRIEELEEKLREMESRVGELSQEVGEKEEAMRQLSKKTLAKQNELQSKILTLEQRLFCQQQECRQLRRYKQEVETASFHNPQEGYQVAIFAELDFEQLNKQIALPLEQLLEMLGTTHQTSNQSIQPVQQEGPNMVPSLNIGAQAPLIPELSLGLEFSCLSEKKEKGYKRACTDRPSLTNRTQRKTRNLNFSQKIEEIQQLSKKYIRTNQLTTKRQSKPILGLGDLPCTASTIKMSDSPKNMEMEQVN